MHAGTSETEQLLGEIEVDAIFYVIVDAGADRYHVVRRTDGLRVGRFRGSPSSMWLLEPETVELDLLRAIVHCAIAEGLIEDPPND
jgi:hypothetical protein